MSNRNTTVDPEMVPVPKDDRRIYDMFLKANGDRSRMLRLATSMASRIGDAAKAYRRGRAAEDQNFHDVAQVFFNRHVALITGQSIPLV